MTDLRQAAQQALEALESGLAFDTHSVVLQNLRTALEQQQAEPICPECKAAVLYECVACSSNNYPPKQQAEPVACDKPSASFNAWWDSYRHDPANPFAEGSAAYWAWAGWKAAQRPWQGLTDEEIHRTTVLLGFNPEWKTEIGMAHAIVRNLEAKLKERNT